jgi:hypothetical protein
MEATLNMSLEKATTTRNTNRLTDLALRAAAHPRMEAAILGAIRAELPGVIEGLLRDMFSGQQIKMYAPKRTSSQRADRDRRIKASLIAGHAIAEVARREGVSVRSVQRKAAALDRS